MNDSGARFCANCGTTLGGAAPANPNPIPMQQQPPASGPYSMENSAVGGNSIAKNIGIGCLIAIAIFFFVGLSCTRACFGLRHRRPYVMRRY